MNDDSPERDLSQAIAVFAITFAYFALPILRFANAEALFLVGVGVGLSAASAWLSMRKRSTKGVVASFALFVGISVFSTTVINEATWAYRANDQRCEAIETDMLAVRPTRSDGPALFEALGCRPVTRGAFKIERTKDAEPPAGSNNR